MSDPIFIYTDGAAEPNPGPGGYGVVLISGQNRKELSGGMRLTTNNRMELLAVITALEALKRPVKATLVSDSKYVLEAIMQGHVQKWKRNGWKLATKKRAKNADLWERFLLAYEPHEITFQWIKGHAGHKENERCDELAVAACKSASLPEDAGYLEEMKLQKAEGTAPAAIIPESLPPERLAGPCPKCGAPMVKQTTKNKKHKPGQAYYYEWVKICSGCRRLYLDEAAKRSI